MNFSGYWRVQTKEMWYLIQVTHEETPKVRRLTNNSFYSRV